MKKTEKSELTRNKILKNAIKLFGENSYEGTSIKEIAIASNISQGLLYNYFESKEKLLIEIFEIASDAIKGSFETKNQHTLLTLEIYFDNIVKATSKNHNLWRIVHSAKFNKSIMKLISKQIKTMNSFILNLLQDLIVKTNPNCTQEEIKLYFATIDGLVAHSLVLKNYDLKAEFNELIKIIRNSKVEIKS